MGAGESGNHKRHVPVDVGQGFGKLQSHTATPEIGRQRSKAGFPHGTSANAAARTAPRTSLRGAAKQ